MKMHEILFFFIIGLILYGLATLNFNLLLLFIIMCNPYMHGQRSTIRQGQEINEIHSQYKEESERLYDKHKEINGYVPMKFY